MKVGLGLHVRGHGAGPIQYYEKEWTPYKCELTVQTFAWGRLVYIIINTPKFCRVGIIGNSQGYQINYGDDSCYVWAEVDRSQYSIYSTMQKKVVVKGLRYTGLRDVVKTLHELIGKRKAAVLAANMPRD